MGAVERGLYGCLFRDGLPQLGSDIFVFRFRFAGLAHIDKDFCQKEGKVL